MKKKFSIFILSLVMMVSAFSSSGSVVYGAVSTSSLSIAIMGSFTVTNAEGQYFKFDANTGETTGDMQILSADVMKGVPPELQVTVNNSSSFTFRGDPKKENYFCIDGDNPDAQVYAKNADSITIGASNGNTKVSVEGNNLTYQIDMAAPNNSDGLISVEGTAKSKLEVQDGPQGVSISGASGITTFTRDDLKGAKNSEKSTKFISYASPVLISSVDSYPFNMKGAYVVGKKSYNVISALRATRIADRSLMVTWGKVKNAKGYMVYRYNSEKKKYVKVKTIKNPKYTMFVDRNLPLNKAYTYRVKSYTVVKGKTKAGKLSYYVSAVTASDTRDNAAKITPSKASVSGKAGTGIRMKGTVTTVDGKRVCSSSLRWFSKNKKVATITKAGKLTLKAKGKTYIWAKSHNGENVAVKVTVK